jgi:hypothetical protein
MSNIASQCGFAALNAVVRLESMKTKQVLRAPVLAAIVLALGCTGRKSSDLAIERPFAELTPPAQVTNLSPILMSSSLNNKLLTEARDAFQKA